MNDSMAIRIWSVQRFVEMLQMKIPLDHSYRFINVLLSLRVLRMMIGFCLKCVVLANQILWLA